MSKDNIKMDLDYDAELLELDSKKLNVKIYYGDITIMVILGQVHKI
jgi:hypothetical protein